MFVFLGDGYALSLPVCFDFRVNGVRLCHKLNLLGFVRLCLTFLTVFISCWFIFFALVHKINLCHFVRSYFSFCSFISFFFLVSFENFKGPVLA